MGIMNLPWQQAQSHLGKCKLPESSQKIIIFSCKASNIVDTNKVVDQAFTLTYFAIGAILRLFTTETGSNNTGTPDSYATGKNNLT